MKISFRSAQQGLVLSAAFSSMLVASALLAPGSWAQETKDEADGASLAKLGAVTIEGSQIKVELSSNSKEVLNCTLTPAVELAPGGHVVAASAQELVLRPHRTLTVGFDFATQIQAAGEAAKEGIKGYVTEASTFACEIVREDGDLWVDDNGAARHESLPDQFSYVLHSQSENNKVEGLLHSVADYVRLCDAVITLEFATSDGDLTMKERRYSRKLMLLPGQSMPLSADFSETLETDPRFVLQGVGLSLSCLRWTGITLPDPKVNQMQRPKALPHEVCDPSSTPCVPVVQKEIVE